jgi:chromosome segregation ATPase
MQKEWKTIGMVPKKLGDQLWAEFLAACNTFFEARNAAGAGQRGEERENLDKKLDIIARLKAIAEETGDDLADKVQKLVEEYNSVGHVPYKEKDNVYKEYHAILDKLYKDLNISTAKRRLNNFKQNLKNVAERGENALDNERARLFHQYEALKQEIQTYENNLGFLNASSKKGNSLIDEMNRKVQKLKDDMNLIREKIKAIDAENKQ